MKFSTKISQLGMKSELGLLFLSLQPMCGNISKNNFPGGLRSIDLSVCIYVIGQQNFISPEGADQILLQMPLFPQNCKIYLSVAKTFAAFFHWEHKISHFHIIFNYYTVEDYD